MQAYKCYGKLNLFLNIIGKDEKNFHLLESMAAVTEDVYDELSITESTHNLLEIEGPFAKLVPNDSSNLVFKALALFNLSKFYHIKLKKNIPVAAGLGGGSSNAAIIIKYIIESNKLKLTFDEIEDLCHKIGSDISICYLNQACYFNNTGRVDKIIENLPNIYCLLVNNGEIISAKDAYLSRIGDFSKTIENKITQFNNVEEFISFLEQQNNDLYQGCLSLVPSLKDVIALINEQQDCLLSRMTGSGATCFGLFKNYELAQNAANIILSKNPNWWVKVTKLN